MPAACAGGEASFVGREIASRDTAGEFGVEDDAELAGRVSVLAVRRGGRGWRALKL